MSIRVGFMVKNVPEEEGAVKAIISLTGSDYGV
jgi:hypothetical protein